MHASQLIGLLKILDKQELKRLGKYLKSDYHNTKQYEKVIQLFVYLIKHHPDYPIVQINRAKVHYLLFKKEEKSNVAFNKVIYFLKQLIEDFIVMLEQDQQPYLKEKLLLQFLKRRNHSTFPKRNEKLIKSINQNKQRPLNTNDQLYLFELNYAQWSDINTEKIDTKSNTLQNANENLDKYYFLNKLKIILEYEAYKSILNRKMVIPEENEILQLANSHPYFKSNVTIDLILKAIKLAQNQDIKSYRELKTALFYKIGLLSKKDARDIWVVLNNFCVKQLGTNPLFATQDGFILFCFADENNLLLENNRIRNIEYTNAAVFGFYIGENEKTLILIEKYKPHLALVQRQIAYDYALANYYFRQNDFNQVTDLLYPISQVEKLDLATNVRIKSMNIRASFEIWEQKQYPFDRTRDSLEDLIDSFLRYIERNKKLAKERKHDYLVFNKILKRIVNIKTPFNNHINKLEKVVAEIENPTISIGFKPWLVTKIKRMIENLPQKN